MADCLKYEYLRMLSASKMTLIMSLPVNDPALCRAAFDAGADVVKVHINVEHRASGTCFGRLADEEPVLREMLAAATGPMGIVPGNAPERILTDLSALQTLPFAFYSVYASHAPAALMRTGLPVMAALDSQYTDAQIISMMPCGVSVIEASVVPGEAYGTPLTLKDLLQYHQIAAQSRLPVVVPTQKKITPEDVPQLIQCGVKGLMIGAVVTGRTRETITASIRSFREAIDIVK